MTTAKGTYMSNRGYAIPKDGNLELIQELRDVLTVSPKVNPNVTSPDAQSSFIVYRESASTMYVPKYYGLSKFGAPTRSKLSTGNDAPGLIFNGNLREEQQIPIKAFIDAARDPIRMGGIISVGCGQGKTIMGLYLASVFKKRTLIVCHKEFLMNQWRERIQQFLPQAQVGIIKQSKVDIDGKDIVIGSLQSLAMRDYDPAVFETFGMVCFDECHHNSAEVFSRSMSKMNIPITLGLSATLNRKDGLRKVFEWYIGKPVYKNTKREDKQLVVHSHPYFHKGGDAYGKEVFMYNRKLNISRMITTVCEYPPRNRYIITTLQELLLKEPGRKTLILSDRREHLRELERLVLAAKLGTVGYYVGGMKEDDLKASEDKDIILATFSMAAEGMDIPVLNTLILASPVSAIEQPIGRIQRQKPHDRKYIPVVIDIWDTFSIFQRQGASRMAFYKKQGYEIKGEQECEESSEPKTYDFIPDDD
jgi:superfamily II DNA or RNA helicase